MTEHITVFHREIPGNGSRTMFEGKDIEFLVLEDGSLSVIRWRTTTQVGRALFAPGQWVYVCQSRDLTAGEQPAP